MDDLVFQGSRPQRTFVGGTPFLDLSFRLWTISAINIRLLSIKVRRHNTLNLFCTRRHKLLRPVGRSDLLRRTSYLREVGVVRVEGYGDDEPVEEHNSNTLNKVLVTGV